MPRYFFHVHDGGSVPDDLGVNLPDIDAARSAAIELSCERFSAARPLDHSRITRLAD